VDRSVVDAYEAGGPAPARAVAGLSEDDLNARPVPGTWSIRQIVLHLMDSDLIATDRMKRIASMARPLILGYDETAFSELPGTPTADAALACELFEKNRRMTAHFLRALPDEAFERFGIHNESGKVTLAAMVQGYIDHLEHHLGFIRRKREMLGKPAP
jgi:uncharacterized damage-inducible protein DinB